MNTPRSPQELWKELSYYLQPHTRPRRSTSTEGQPLTVSLMRQTVPELPR